MTDLYDPIPELDGTRQGYTRLADAMSDVAVLCDSPIDDWMRAGADGIRAAIQHIPGATEPSSGVVESGDAE
jgi:hypothetical protein